MTKREETRTVPRREKIYQTMIGKGVARCADHKTNNQKLHISNPVRLTRIVPLPLSKSQPPREVRLGGLHFKEACKRCSCRLVPPQSLRLPRAQQSKDYPCLSSRGPLDHDESIQNRLRQNSRLKKKSKIFALNMKHYVPVHQIRPPMNMFSASAAMPRKQYATMAVR